MKLPGLLLFAGLALGASLHAQDFSRTAVPPHQVRLSDDFWSTRLETNRTVTIPYAFAQCESTGRVLNFAIAAGRADGEQCGVYPFDDSDVYKIIEGASYTLRTHPDPQLERYVDSLIVLIRTAQEPDGYIYTARTNKAKFLVQWAGAERWSRLSGSHELYNLGHLYEAAVAHFEATQRRDLLDVALKSAALLLREFGPGKLDIPPGHQEVEIGLAKLARVTGDTAYIALARFFLEQRGRSHGGRALWGTYSQDHTPVLEQDEAVGHAVRALYMLSGMVDVAALAGDSRYADAAERLWTNIVRKKMYLTGGLGAQGMIEGFGPPYELPNLSAYCETCASIAHVLFNHRMFLLRGESKYLDVLERTLYNGLLSGAGMTGDRFFYPNPLGSRGQVRSPWFACACCPSNLTRFIPQIPGMAYATGREDLYVNLFVGSSATTEVAGTRLTVRQETEYPFGGEVTIRIDPVKPVTMNLRIRVPGWCRNEPVPEDLYRYLDTDTAQVRVSLGGAISSHPVESGFLTIRRRWTKGDVVVVSFPMSVRRVVAHDSVAADRGRAALERGPLVYCAEWVDHDGGKVMNLVLPDTSALEVEGRPDMLGGVQVISGTALSTRIAPDGRGVLAQPAPFLAIPYYAWAHRGKGEMVVWLPRSSAVAEPLGGSRIATRSSVTSSGGSGEAAVQDNVPPASSRDTSAGVWRSTVRDTVWIQYDFPAPEEISAMEVYWYDGGRGCPPPESWRVLLRYNGAWSAAYNPDKTWGVERNTFNRVSFEAFKTDAVRLEVIPQKGSAAGVLEWRVY